MSCTTPTLNIMAMECISDTKHYGNVWHNINTTNKLMIHTKRDFIWKINVENLE